SPGCRPAVAAGEPGSTDTTIAPTPEGGVPVTRAWARAAATCFAERIWSLAARAWSAPTPIPEAGTTVPSPGPHSIHAHANQDSSETSTVVKWKLPPSPKPGSATSPDTDAVTSGTGPGATVRNGLSPARNRTAASTATTNTIRAHRGRGRTSGS